MVTARQLHINRIKGNESAAIECFLIFLNTTVDFCNGRTCPANSAYRRRLTNQRRRRSQLGAPLCMSNGYV